ncbi:MAG: hypothetical protein F6K28_45935 [Microcoleus sp. SIO2G3]|nr:hypothetical protein [Microcoleus sp. SIO2G3]
MQDTPREISSLCAAIFDNALYGQCLSPVKLRATQGIAPTPIAPCVLAPAQTGLN